MVPYNLPKRQRPSGQFFATVRAVLLLGLFLAFVIFLFSGCTSPVSPYASKELVKDELTLRPGYTQGTPMLRLKLTFNKNQKKKGKKQ